MRTRRQSAEPAVGGRVSSIKATAPSALDVTWEEAWIRHEYAQGVEISVPLDWGQGQRRFSYTATLKTAAAPMEAERDVLDPDVPVRVMDSATLVLEWYDDEGTDNKGPANKGEVQIPMTLSGLGAVIELLQRVRDTQRRREHGQSAVIRPTRSHSLEAI